MAKTRIAIKRIVTMGDSLTDRGTLAKRYIGGLIPMSYLADLPKLSPKGRFTNYYVWDDDFAAMLASRFLAESLKQSKQFAPQESSMDEDTEISDDIIGKGSIYTEIPLVYSLADDKVVKYDGTDFFNSYAEGGLTAADWSKQWTWNPSNEAARKMVSTLSAKRELLIKDDEKQKKQFSDNADTLIIEWSGANDLLTVNSSPSKEIVDKAIAARVANVKALFNKGYKHFILNTLPDFSKTPRFQALSKKEQANAHECCEYFNKKLKEECEKLNKDFGQQGLNVDVFEVDKLFDRVYENPEEYGFDPTKKSKAFTTSKDFSIKDHISPAPAYLFWDDIHPTAKLHEIIAEKFYDKYSNSYDFEMPAVKPVSSAQALLELFLEKYKAKLVEDQKGYFGNWRYSGVDEKLKKGVLEDVNDYLAELENILQHATTQPSKASYLSYCSSYLFNESGTRTREVLIELGWMDKHGKINTNIPVLEICEKKLKLDLESKPVLN